MAAGRVVLSEYMPARDRYDRLVSGAKIYVYENETTTLAAIFTSAALTTPLANPVVANSSGQFAEIWADKDESYTLSVTGPNGESIGNPSVFDDCSPSTEDSAAESAAAAEAAQAAAEAAAAEATGGLFKTVSATTYTLLEADNRYSIRFTAATAVTVTVPAGLTHHFLVGIRQAGLGQVTVSPAMGVTIANADDAFTTESEGVILSLSSSASNTYDLDGRTV